MGVSFTGSEPEQTSEILNAPMSHLQVVAVTSDAFGLCGAERFNNRPLRPCVRNTQMWSGFRGAISSRSLFS